MFSKALLVAKRISNFVACINKANGKAAQEPRHPAAKAPNLAAVPRPEFAEYQKLHP